MPTDSPARAAGAGNPLRALKKLPPVAWLGIGGAVLGLGYAYVRDKKSKDISTIAPDDTQGVDGMGPDAGVAGYGTVATNPAAVGYVNPAPPLTEPAETVGAIGQTALETVTESLAGIVTAALETRQPSQADLAALIAAYPRGFPAQTSPSSPPSTAARTAPSAKRVSLPPGYHRGSSIHGRNFPGAIGWALVTRGHGIEVYHIRYNWGMQRWHYDYQGAHKGAWNKVWEKRY